MQGACGVILEQIIEFEYVQQTVYGKHSETQEGISFPGFTKRRPRLSFSACHRVILKMSMLALEEFLMLLNKLTRTGVGGSLWQCHRDGSVCVRVCNGCVCIVHFCVRNVEIMGTV